MARGRGRRRRGGREGGRCGGSARPAVGRSGARVARVGGCVCVWTFPSPPPDGSPLPLVTRALPRPAEGLSRLASPSAARPLLGASPPPRPLPSEPLWQRNRWGKFGGVMRSRGGNGCPPPKGSGERSGVAGTWLAEASWAGPPRSLRLPHLSFGRGGGELLGCTGDGGTGPFSARGRA